MTTSASNALASHNTTRLMKSSPIYYGWIIWAVGTWGLIATSPGQSYSVSLFFDHFVADFDLSRTVVSSLYGAGTLVSAASLTFVGKAIDRYGNRRMGLLISAAFAVVLVAFSLVTGPVTLLIGFALIRGLGQGALSLNSSTSIANWFQRKRGLAMGLSTFVNLVAQGLYVLGLNALVKSVGWRGAWIVLGISVALTILPASSLLARGRPVDFGIEVDGGPQGAAPGESSLLRWLLTSNRAQHEDNWTLAQAVRTPIYWVILCTGALQGAWATGLVVHQQSLFGVVGHAPQVAVQNLAFSSIVAAVSALVAGPVINRTRPGAVAAVQMGLLALGLMLATVMTPPWATVLYALATGTSIGITLVFMGVAVPSIYGRLHQGAILGPMSAGMAFGAAVGPLIFSLGFDTVGNYNLSLGFAAVLCIMVMIAGLIVREPSSLPAS